MPRQSRKVGTNVLILLLLAAITLPLLVQTWRFMPRIEIRRSVELVEVGVTPLHRVIVNRAPLETVAQIIEANPNDLDTVDSYLGRPIDVALVESQRSGIKDRNAVVELLLQHGASPNGPSRAMISFRHYTPLHSAVYNDDLELVDLLLAYGADTTARSSDGETALDIARKRGHVEIVALLEKATSKQRNSTPGGNSEVINR